MEKYKKKERLFALLPVIILVLTVFFAGSPVKAEQKTHTIWFFFENVCASCHEEDDFYDLFNRCVTAEEKASIFYDIRTYNVFKSADEAVFEETLKENGKVKTDVTLPVLYIDGQWLSGYDKIEKELHGVLFEEKTASESSENNIENSEISTEKTSRWALPEIDAEGDEPAILLFTTYSCSACEEIKEYLKDLLEEKDFVLTEVNVAEGENIQLFKELVGAFGRDADDGKVPAVFAGETALLGKDEIEEKLPELLEKGEAPYEKLEEKLKNIPPEQIEAPEAYIAVPALQNISYCMDNDELRDMYANLLANSMTSIVKNGVHPGFVDIIKQLSPDEAKILRYFATKNVIPTITLRYENNDGSGSSVIKNFSNVGELTQCENQYTVNKYFDNLNRLGLVESSAVMSSLTDKTLYEPLKKHSYIKTRIADSVVKKAGFEKYEIEEGYMSITDYGREFCNICISKTRITQG